MECGAIFRHCQEWQAYGCTKDKRKGEVVMAGTLEYEQLNKNLEMVDGHAVKAPEDYQNPEQLYQALVARVRKYHPLSLYFQWAAIPYSAVLCISSVRIWISKGCPEGPINVVWSD